MKKIIAFGEIMLRLKAPGSERLLQRPVLEATFGGGEANVAVGLARFGMDVAYVSLIPPNRIGDACVALGGAATRSLPAVAAPTLTHSPGLLAPPGGEWRAV